jgi:hypothetical protein
MTLLSVVDVHVVDSLWPTVGFAGVVGIVGSLVGAYVGGRLARKASREAQDAAAKVAADTQARDRFVDSARPLLEALLTHGQLLSDVLEPGDRQTLTAEFASFGSPNWTRIKDTQARESHTRLFALLATTVPLVPNPELRNRLRTAGELAHSAWLMTGSDPRLFRRASSEVAGYFRWLRWNLVVALDSQPLPRELAAPVLDRPLSETPWLSPDDIPNYT